MAPSAGDSSHTVQRSADVQTARAADTSKFDFDIPECSPAEGIGAAVEITGLRHVPLTALRKLYTDCRCFWKSGWRQVLARLGSHRRRPRRRLIGVVLSRIGIALWAGLSVWQHRTGGYDGNHSVEPTRGNSW